MKKLIKRINKDSPRAIQILVLNLLTEVVNLSTELWIVGLSKTIEERDLLVSENGSLSQMRYLTEVQSKGFKP